MDTRISTHSQVDFAISQFEAQSATLAKLQDEISSGIAISRPSDAPATYVQIMSGHAQTQQLQTYQTTINTANTNLNEGVSALQNVNQILTKATQIASEGANSSTDDAGYKTMATEINGLIQQMISAANSKVNGHYLFGGSATNKQPFTVASSNAAGQPAQISYQGSDQPASMLVGPGETVNTQYAGSQVFQQPGTDVFQTLIGLRDDLQNPALDLTAKAQAASQRLAQLQQGQNAILGTIGEQSSSLETLQTMGSRFSDLLTATKEQTSTLESTDLADAVVRLQEQQNLFQATLQVTSRLFSNSFQDFIK